MFYADVSAGPEAPWVVLVHDENIPEGILKKKKKRGKSKSKKAGNPIGASELFKARMHTLIQMNIPDKSP